MRRSRRGSRGVEYPSSGEDSFVAVVVTKLTGALLFILLLTMVIMALLPRAVDSTASAPDPSATPLTITTTAALPEAIAGRPYGLALAATGTTQAARWSVVGTLPEGLQLDPASGRIEGTPTKAVTQPVELTLIVADGGRRATQAARLVVYEPTEPLALASPWIPRRTQVALRAWLQNGFGFLVLILIHCVGMSALAGLESRAVVALAGGPNADSIAAPRRFAAYRLALRLGTLGALAGLTFWLIRPFPG
jgi:hypothetical protein